MVFKLIRTDSEEPCKIQLCIGKHVLGRGKFLDCDDKRVSRNHGELEVMEDTVIVKALHQNPCFIIRKESADTQILEQNCSSSISNGDRFGLLPHTYWYELLHCSVADDDQQLKSAVSEVNEDMDSVATEPFEVEKDVSQEINFDLNETVANDESPGSPSMLPTECNEVAAATTTETTIDDNKEGEKTAIKRSHSSQSEASKLCCESYASIEASSSTIKKIKTEDEPKIKQEPVDIKDSSNAAVAIDNDQAGPSTSNDKGDGEGPSTSNDKANGDGPSTSNDKVDGDGPSTSNDKVDGDDQSTSNDKGDGDKDAGKAPASPLKRERCMYGANCYRRNPAHKAQFSHPSDADYGAGARAACPWGAACRRRDPRHWRDHDHPPGVQPPAAGMQVVHKRGNTFYINAHTVNFYDDHFQVLDSDEDSVDYDYEF